MKSSLLRFLLAIGGLAATSTTAHAVLKPGDAAPNFSTQAALGGQAFQFELSQALKKGPVVLYFFPKAFTEGCTVEAHLFAEATDKFQALGASVIGISRDGIGTQKKFSMEACRSKFPVGADSSATIIKQYDAKLTMLPVSGRVSYVIAPNGKIIHTYSSMDPQGHVAHTLKAVQDWKASHRP